MIPIRKYIYLKTLSKKKFNIVALPKTKIQTNSNNRKQINSLNAPNKNSKKTHLKTNQ